MKNAFLREQETKEALANFIRSADKLSMGEQCRRFEEVFAAKQGRGHAILLNKELFQQYTMAFAGAGIEIRPMIAGNMQRQPFYRKYVNTEYTLPNTDFIHECGFYAENYPELTRADLETFKSGLLR